MSSRNQSRKHEKRSEKHSTSHRSSKKYGHEYTEDSGEQEAAFDQSSTFSNSLDPRTFPSIDDLANDVGNLSVGEGGTYESSRSYSHDQHLRSKGKGKAVKSARDESELDNVPLADYGGEGEWESGYGSFPSTQPLDPDFGGTNLDPIDEAQTSSIYSSSMPTTSGIVPEIADYNDRSSMGVTYSSTMSHGSNEYSGLGDDYVDDDDENPELAEAYKQSRDMYYGGQVEGESSGATAPNYLLNMDDYDGGPAGTSAPSGRVSKKKLNDSLTWPEDDRFGVCPTSMYQPGQVFKVVWAEPKGAAGKRKEPLETTPGYPYTEKGKKKGENSKQFYTGVRRFIVTATEVGSSICVPILTYEGRACTKRGVKARNHGIVYAPPDPPLLLQDEPEHGFAPIRMELYAEGETLVKESRVNYSKLVTIEHNINVLFIGQIWPEDFEYVSEAVDDCWNRRIREPKRDHKKKHK